MRTRSLLSIPVLLLALGGTAAAYPERVDTHNNYQRQMIRMERQANRELQRHHFQQVLDITEQGLSTAPNDPVLLYDRAAALRGLGRLDESIAASEGAEHAYVHDEHGRAQAIFQRALTLQQMGRCDEASIDFQRYAQIVGARDRHSARLALNMARQCRTRGTTHTFAGRPYPFF